MKDLTFLIPIRIDTLERLQNLTVTTNYLLDSFATNIILLVADKQNIFFNNNIISPEVEIHFIEDYDSVFHRTKYLNILTKYASTPFIALWDADVVVNPIQLNYAIDKLREGFVDFIFPYDGSFYDTGYDCRTKFINSLDITLLENSVSEMFVPYGYGACGGGFLAKKESYIATGMENEKFYGWGQEDGERVKRWEILGKTILRVTGSMFHLTHPRGGNSGYRSEENRIEFISEYLRICRMSEFELNDEIRGWSHTNNMINQNCLNKI